VKCHHWTYVSPYESRFGKWTETLPDGRKVDHPYMKDPGPVAMSDAAIAFEAVFFDQASCPVCAGGPCPDCEEPA